MTFVIVNVTESAAQWIDSRSTTGFFDRYIIQGTMNQVVTLPTAWTVQFTTNGANCDEATLDVTFNLVPQPVVTLTSSGTADRTACTSTTIVPIRYEIATAFTLTETVASNYRREFLDRPLLKTAYTHSRD